MITVFNRRRRDGLKIGSCAWFCHSNCRDDFATCHFWQPALALLFAAVAVYIVSDDARMYAVAKSAYPGMTHLFDQHHLMFKVATATAVFFRDRRTQNAGLSRDGPSVTIDNTLFLPTVSVRHEFFG